MVYYTLVRLLLCLLGAMLALALLAAAIAWGVKGLHQPHPRRGHPR